MTNNKFYNETASLSVYVANLEEYVKGNLVGDWVSLPIEENDWKDFLKQLETLKRSQYMTMRAIQASNFLANLFKSLILE